jgi:hypothetical protein
MRFVRHHRTGAGRAMNWTSLFHSVVLGLFALAGCAGGADNSGLHEGASSTAVGSRSDAVGTPPICTAADLASCAQQNLATERCLTLYQACGRYLDIVEHYKSEAWSTDPNKWYYLGVAYHGLFVRNRSAAAKCQFGTAARLALQAYLRQSYVNQGYNDQRVFQQTGISAERLI